MNQLFINGLALVFAVLFIRALPWPTEWLKKKPLSCDACMTGWWSIISSPWWRAEGTSWSGVLASAGVGMLLLALHRWLVPEPPVFGENVLPFRPHDE